MSAAVQWVLPGKISTVTLEVLKKVINFEADRGHSAANAGLQTWVANACRPIRTRRQIQEDRALVGGNRAGKNGVGETWEIPTGPSRFAGDFPRPTTDMPGNCVGKEVTLATYRLPISHLKISALTLVAILGLGSANGAGTARADALSEVVRTALETHPLVSATRSGFNAAQHGIEQARARNQFCRLFDRLGLQVQKLS